jgi:hypothetical protein
LTGTQHLIAGLRKLRRGDRRFDVLLFDLLLVVLSLAAGTIEAAAEVPEAADVAAESAAIVDAAPATAAGSVAESVLAVLVAVGWFVVAPC